MSRGVHELFHETWLGMVQPIDGLVLSVPVLVEAQCMERHNAALQQQFAELIEESEDEATRIRDVGQLFETLLDLRPDDFDAADALADELSLYVPEGHQTLRPTQGLRHQGSVAETVDDDDTSGTDHEATPASLAGRGYAALIWQLPDGLDLDKPETETGDWEYPAAAKFDRLLRHCRVSVGLLTNREVVRLVYAPHGESSGSITFRVADMTETGGRPILDALVMLLHARRWFGVADEHTLPSLLRESRRRQADVTNELAEQVFEALSILLRGFEAADERDGRRLLHAALDSESGHGADSVYGGLLTVLLRLVFILYCEDRGLLPVESTYYSKHLSVLGLFDRLREDHGSHPDSMAERFGAWAQLIALFRTIYLGARHGDLVLPARKGDLFDPHRFPFLEGWGVAGSAPITMAEHRAAVRVPQLDDGTVFEVLDRLLMLGGQRLSYRALDVEQIGSVYEALMGYHVVRLPAPAVCLRPKKVWISAEECAEQSKTQLPKWLKERARLQKSDAGKLAKAFLAAEESDDTTLLEVQLELLATKVVKNTHRAAAGQLVLQPGPERRRTSSHYTPRSLSEPIVKRMLEPLIRAMGDEPSSEALLELKICDPAMGSGAFLVETCRALADLVIAAWTREGKLDKVADVNEDVVNHARRLVAQRCLYGVDKNPFAVQLAKLSLWLLTMARDLPFTFVDHALKHGDSLVGLPLERIKEFRWEKRKKRETKMLTEFVTGEAIDEALGLRNQILDLAADGSEPAQREKELLLDEAEHALERLRIIGDLIVGAFFAETKSKAREDERRGREALVLGWLSSDEALPPELDGLRHELRSTQAPFHWALEFPEVFHAERADPLSSEGGTEPAGLDGFVGNPPFLAGSRVSTELGHPYADWLNAIHASGKQGDLCAHFFRRAQSLLGDHGTIGLIATNTIAQGDTREAGLQPMLADGYRIFDAIPTMTWPGDAAVSIATVHLACGKPAQSAGSPQFDRTAVAEINSRLRPSPERSDPVALAANAGLSFSGSKIYGQGFVVTPEEHAELVAKNPRNTERVFPYLGGEEINTSPTQDHQRFVINFSSMDLEEAERWPDLISIVREKVKPERDNNNREIRRRYWWRFGEPAPALYKAIAPLSRCLVNSFVSKHLAFAFQPVNRVFSHNTCVMPLSTFSAFATLQSRCHEIWARLLSSTLETRLNYRPSDCFENFPFPDVDPRARLESLENVGEILYATRADLMLAREHGLTVTYNKLKDPGCMDEDIQALRQAHVELDRAVLAAYDWDDIDVPPYVTPLTSAEGIALDTFEDKILDRLFSLNTERASRQAH
jgi:Eco57I restriction-modification methylase/MmeI, target recognition domain